ncbi:hypothetical protein [Kribbella sindirgiensis]|uniref:hypothetical protein n=1 Tax=Kribbella sindirgiensis TaxID=1124744 RepID=UPI0013F47EE3|nr:hypothetical protein [Kribbella sindirgiensis]
MPETKRGGVTECQDNYQGPRCGTPTRADMFQGIYCACERPQQEQPQPTTTPKGDD